MWYLNHEVSSSYYFSSFLFSCPSSSHLFLFLSHLTPFPSFSSPLFHPFSPLPLPFLSPSFPPPPSCRNLKGGSTSRSEYARLVGLTEESIQQARLPALIQMARNLSLRFQDLVQRAAKVGNAQVIYFAHKMSRSTTASIDLAHYLETIALRNSLLVCSGWNTVT
jgi:hypothetical protein